MSVSPNAAAPSVPNPIIASNDANSKNAGADVAVRFLLLMSIGLVALWASFLPWARIARGQNDFLGLYSGSALAGHADLYAEAPARALQEKLADIKIPAEVFMRPPFYAALLKPLTFLPFRAAYVLYSVLNLMALAVFLGMMAPRDRVLWIVGGVSIPVLTGFANGQDVLLVLLICAISILLARREKKFLAGMALSLCLVKFHLFPFVPLVLLLRKQWRMLAGGGAGGGVLYAVSAMVQGWAWPVEYLRFLRTPQLSPAPYSMPNLHGLVVATIGGNLTVELILSLMIACLVVFFSTRYQTDSPDSPREFELIFAMSVVAGLLTSHHGYIQDCSLLLLVAALADGGSKLRVVSLALLAPPAYFLLLANGPVSALVPLGIVAMVAWFPFEKSAPIECAR